MKPIPKMRLILAAFLGISVVLPLLGPGSSWAVTLFNTHHFGAQRSEIAQAPEVTDCSAGLDRGKLCRRNFKYLDLTWRMGYRFTHDRLTQILLFREYNAADRTRLLKKLSQDYRLAALKRGGGLLDLVRLSSRESKAAYRQKMKRFEKKGLAESDLVYVFFEKMGLTGRAKKAKSVREMMIKMSVLTRELDVWVEEKDGAKRFVLSFAMPRAVMGLKARWEKRNQRADQDSNRSGAHAPRDTPDEERSYEPPSEPFIRGEGRL